MGKYFKYAIGEILLVVIGILIALQVNNWNISQQEQKRVRQYAKSLIEDLQADIDMLRISQGQALRKIKQIDSLRYLIGHMDYTKLSNTDLYIMTNDVMYRPYKWNRSTLNEITNSGSSRFIKNEELQNKLVAYESFSYHLDDDFQFDITNAFKANDQVSNVLNLNSPYLNMTISAEIKHFNDAKFNVFTSKEYLLSKQNDLELLSTDKVTIQKFVNIFILIQEQYEIRARQEMAEIIGDAQELIALLKNEYDIND